MSIKRKTSKISRREFNSRLTKIGLGIASGGIFPSFGNITRNEYPEGKIKPGGAAVKLLEKYPNMYADLSANSGLNAITRDPDFGINFLNNYADKLLFGTDAMGGTGRQYHFDFYNEVDLSQEVRNKIFRDNTRKLLKI